MAIQVDVPTIMRPLTNNNKKIQVSGGNLHQIIENMNQQYPGVKERLLSGDQLNRYINIFINDDDVRFTGLLDTQVTDGDVITILPAVAGG